MDLIVELIRSHDGGETIDVVPLNQPNDPIEARLGEVVAFIQGWIAMDGVTAQLEASWLNPFQVDSAFEDLATQAINMATLTQQFAKFSGSPLDVEVAKGIKIPSSHVPGHVGWVDARAYTCRLDVSTPEPTGNSGLSNLLPPLIHFESVKVEHPAYYLNIRPVSQDSSSYCEYSIPAPPTNPEIPGTSFHGLYAFFTPTRTTITSVEIHPVHTPVNSLPNRARRTMDIEQIAAGYATFHEELLPVNGEVVLEIGFVGDPPHLRGATWLHKSGPVIEAPDKRSTDIEPLPVPHSVGWPIDDDDSVLPQYAVSFEEAMAHRKALVNAMEEPKADHEFFLALDEASHPLKAMVNGESNTVESTSLGLFLTARFTRRAELAHFNGFMDADEFEVKSHAAQAEGAGRLLLGLIQEHFHENSTTGFPKTAAAFERFATGELHLFDAHGAPNGTNMFSFPELALFLIEAQIDLASWVPLFGILGRASELFAVCFHQCGAGRTLCSYRIANNVKGHRAKFADEAYREDLRALWEGPLAPPRYRLLVHAALKGDLEAAFQDGSPGTQLTLIDRGCGRTPGLVAGFQRRPTESAPGKAPNELPAGAPIGIPISTEIPGSPPPRPDAIGPA